MKLTLIEAPYDWADRTTQKVRSYGLERLAGHLKQKLSYVDFTFFENYDLKWIPKSDVYGFSVMHPNYNNSLRMAQELKQRDPNSTIIFGGPSVSDLKQEIIEVHKQVDIIVEGMAEESFKKLIKLISKYKNKVPGRKLSGIPDISFRFGGLPVRTEIVYPPKGWDKIKPAEINNLLPSKYLENHYLILGALGCRNRCQFCNIIKAQPKLYDRSNKEIIRELKLRIRKSKISVQIIHQNFTHRLKGFLSDLEKNNLLKFIKTISFNSRTDTFLDSITELVYVLKKYPKIGISIYLGIENYDDDELKRLTKGVSSKTNAVATSRLIDLEKSFVNFSFIASFIGFNKKTSRENILNNLYAFKRLYIDRGAIEPFYHFFTSPLRKDLGEALRTGERIKGHYPTEFNEYPDDPTLRKILIDYKAIAEDLPYFADRKDLFYNSIINPELQALVNQNMVWAEFNIITALLNSDYDLANRVKDRCIQDYEMLNKKSLVLPNI